VSVPQQDPDGRVLQFPRRDEPPTAQDKNPSQDGAPSTAVERAPEPPTGGPALDGELMTEDEYQRWRLARKVASATIAQLPAVLQTPQGRAEAAKAAAGHALLVPFRYPKAVARGSAAAVRVWWGWVRVDDLYEASKSGDQLAARYSEIHHHRVRRRWWTAGTAVVTAVGMTIGDLAAGSITWWIVGAAASGTLAVAGRNKDKAGRKPVMGARTLAWAMDGEHMVDAFRAAKLIGKDEGLQFVKMPWRDAGGWALIVDLPPSRKASKVVAAREDLASALAVDEVRLIVERVRGDDGHAGRVSLWIADRDPYGTAPVESPLGALDTWDLWVPLPFGRTARGQLVALPVVWTSLLIGAIPRMGKTFVMRIPMTAAALDPHVRMIVAAGKGGKDLRPFELVAHRYIRDSRPERVLRLIAVLEEAAADIEDRYDRIGEMDDDICPDGKVTPEITRDPQHEMPLTVIAIDEIQNYLEDDTPMDPENPKGKKRGGRVLELLTYIAKTAPAVGYILILATQKPDAQVLPDKLRGQLGTRFALKVMTYQASETILGAGTYKAGMDASKLMIGHKGVGLLLGADGETSLSAGDAVTVRTDFLQSKAIRAACQRGRAAREEAGTLTGDAAGDYTLGELSPEVAERIEQTANAAAPEPATVVEDAEPDELPEVLAALLKVIGDDETGVIPTQELATRLGYDDPANAGARRLGQELRKADIPAPPKGKRRMPGYENPVSVTDLDTVRAAIVNHFEEPQ
jgi:S-DNA-T family DNA segregation ATPase FtsK/SpoIIIE